MPEWITDVYENNYGLTVKVTQQLFHEKSRFQTIDVYDSEKFGRMLVIDGSIMTTERDEFIYHEMMAHVPLCAHPAPVDVLVVGGGDGGTVREVLKHQTVRRIVLCELDPMVIDAARTHLPSLSGSLDDPRVNIVISDGSDFIRDTRQTFDAILIDSTDPTGPGQVLFTKTFYQDARKILKKGGVLAAQTESIFFDPPVLLEIYGNLRSAFAGVESYVAPVFTYLGGLWSWALCRTDRERFFSDTRVEDLGSSTRYYDRETSTRCFSLPGFFKSTIAQNY